MVSIGVSNKARDISLILCVKWLPLGLPDYHMVVQNPPFASHQPLTSLFKSQKYGMNQKVSMCALKWYADDFIWTLPLLTLI